MSHTTSRPDHARLSTGSFLVRGLLAGLVAGIVAFGVAFVVGEPSVSAAIALEQADRAPSGSSTRADPGQPLDGQHAGDHDERTPAAEAGVPRRLQSTLGLLTGTAVAGVTLGGFLGVLSAAALGRFGRLGPRGTTMTVTGVGFAALYVLPFVAYPPSPPAVGRADTIGTRTALYFVFVAISTVAAALTVLVGRRLSDSWGAWYAALAATASFLVLTLGAIALLPGYNEVPSNFPATLLYRFRGGSFVIQLSLWSVLGVTLAEFVHRLTRLSR